MPLHHYLPATYLAAFSADNGFPRRDRKLAIADKVTGRIYRKSAAHVGAIKNFYTVAGTDDPEMIDRIWGDYEAQLARAIGQLIDRHVDAKTWARVLVPFVACMLVRGPDFNERFEGRLGPLKEMAGPDNTNQARMIELQRLLAPITAAKWMVLTVQGPERLITNDLGFAGFRDGETGESGLAVPIDLKRVLVLVPRKRGAVLALRDGKWAPIIEYRTLSAGNHVELNHVSAEWAHRFFFGSDESTVSAYRKPLDEDRGPVPEPFQLGFISGPLARANEFSWHRLVSYLEKPPEDQACLTSAEMDWEAVAAGWKPMVIIPLLSPVSLVTSAVRREGDLVIVDFTNGEKSRGVLQEAERITRAGLSYTDSGDFEKAEQCYRSALVMVEEIGSRLAEADLLGLLGNMYGLRGYFDQAEDHFQKALVIYRDIDMRLGQANQLANLGNIHFHRGDTDKAEEFHKKALPLYEEADDRLALAHQLLNLGNVYRRRGDITESAELRRRALTLYRELGDRAGEADALTSLANIYADGDDLDEAEQLYNQALAINRETGNRLGQANVLGNLGHLVMRKGSMDNARDLLRKAGEMYNSMGVVGEGPEAVAQALEELQHGPNVT